MLYLSEGKSQRQCGMLRRRRFAFFNSMVEQIENGRRDQLKML